MNAPGLPGRPLHSGPDLEPPVGFTLLQADRDGAPTSGAPSQQPSPSLGTGGSNSAVALSGSFCSSSNSSFTNSFDRSSNGSFVNSFNRSSNTGPEGVGEAPPQAQPHSTGGRGPHTMPRAAEGQEAGQLDDSLPP